MGVAEEPRPAAVASAKTAAIATTLAVASILAGCAHHPPRFDPAARRTCLVLSAGGTRGVAELGALAAVVEAHLPISCVVGASVGALTGALFAVAPAQDPTERFHRLSRAYLAETEHATHARGVEGSVALAAVALALSTGFLLPATAAVGGYLLGAATTSRADRARFERVLATEFGGARIEALPVAFATLHQERAERGFTLVVDQSGDLAQAVSASIANPFVFDDVDVTRAPKIDPGSDRVAATPVEDTCRLFPDANLLVVNISGAPAFTSSAMRCPMREVMIDVAAPSPEVFLQGGEAFDRAWTVGHDAVTAALGRPSDS